MYESEDLEMIHPHNSPSNPNETTSLIPPTSSNPSNTTHPSYKEIYLIYISYIIILLLGCGMGYTYYTFHQHISHITQQYHILHHQFIDYQYNNELHILELKDREKHYHNQYELLKNFTINYSKEFNDRIFVLENMTTNADVIDKLHITEKKIHKEMENERYQLEKDMAAVRLNVTQHIALSDSLIDGKLSDVDNRIRRSEDRVNRLIAQTYENVSLAVASADRHIQRMQSNVTAQVATMSASVQGAVTSVGGMVDAAKEDIYQEVQLVHDSMDQYIAFTNNQFAAENDFVKYQLAGSFSLLACLICLWHVTSHLRHFDNPDVQRRVLAILWMVPIYSVTSWLALVFPSSQPALGAFRDCYEAYVVYTFIAFLIAILARGKGRGEVINLLASRVNPQRSNSVLTESDRNGPGSEFGSDSPDCGDDSERSSPKNSHKISAPCSCCIPARTKNHPRALASSILYQCQVMAMQFVLLKPLLAAAPFVFRLCGVDYDDLQPISHGSIVWGSPRLYVMVVANISVCVAFYGLLSFYHITERDLAWCDPWPKFLCVKGVVFMTFWQDILLQLMSGSGLVDSKAAAQIQNLLICIEMFMASIAHFYVFPHFEWAKGYRKEALTRTRIRDTLALPDFVTDVRLMTFGKGWEVESNGSIDRSSPMQKERSTGSRGEETALVDRRRSRSGDISPDAEKHSTWREYGSCLQMRSQDQSDRGSEGSGDMEGLATSLYTYSTIDPPSSDDNEPRVGSRKREPSFRRSVGESKGSPERMRFQAEHGGKEGHIENEPMCSVAAALGSLDFSCTDSSHVPFSSSLHASDNEDTKEMKADTAPAPTTSSNSSNKSNSRATKRSPDVILHGSDEELSTDEDVIVVASV